MSVDSHYILGHKVYTPEGGLGPFSFVLPECVRPRVCAVVETALSGLGVSIPGLQLPHLRIGIVST